VKKLFSQSRISLPTVGRQAAKGFMEIVLTNSKNPHNCGRGFGKRITFEKVKSHHLQFMDFF
jgi:hypothetical protein